MTEHQRLFLVQARADFAVFDLLRKQPNMPSCHLLHYLQMATSRKGDALATAIALPARRPCGSAANSRRSRR